MSTTAYDRTAALRSVATYDNSFPESGAGQALQLARNARLLQYASADAFTHVFPGDRGTDLCDFTDRMEISLSQCPEYHLWVDIPLCKYRCNFCQFPILVVGSKTDSVRTAASEWVDAAIREAQLWLKKVPTLADKTIGEFCLFGGTPTVLPPDEIIRLTDFYRDNFGFSDTTSLRAEGSPDSITVENLAVLSELGFRSLTYGIQSFDDSLLALANRRHTGDQAIEARVNAESAGFTRVDGDLVWGLPGQTVAGFVGDVQTMIDNRFDTIVAIKLHLRSFHDVESAIGHASPAVWENVGVRARIAADGHAWPTLGAQYQMREAAVSLLLEAGYYEHPTTYFPRLDVGPELWRSLNLDQQKQVPQIGIGLGGYSWCDSSEAHTIATPRTYLAALDRSELPIESCTVMAENSIETRAIRMAMSTCQPLNDSVHSMRFSGGSLFTGNWARVFDDLESRGLVVQDTRARTIEPTATGATLIEAIINTEIV